MYGILLTVYYVPTPDHAYGSVQYITTEVTAGWLIRGLHHWGASALVILTVLHMLRVIFHGACKYTREITAWAGLGPMTREFLRKDRLSSSAR